MSTPNQLYDEATDRRVAVGTSIAALKVVEDFFGPGSALGGGRRQFENRSAAGSSIDAACAVTAVFGGAVEISRFIRDQAVGGLRPVTGSALEVMQSSFSLSDAHSGGNENRDHEGPENQ